MSGVVCVYIYIDIYWMIFLLFSFLVFNSFIIENIVMHIVRKYVVGQRFVCIGIVCELLLFYNTSIYLRLLPDNIYYKYITGTLYKIGKQIN